MDFASLMAKEISKAKGSSEPPNPNKNNNPKYIRRGDLEAQRIAAYNEEQERLRREREDRQARKRKHDEEEAQQRHEREEKRRRLAEESHRRKEAEHAAQERERRRKLGLPEVDEPSTREGSKERDGDGEGEDIPDEELVEKLRGFDEPARLFGESHRGRLRRYRRLLARSLQPKFSDTPIPTTLELVPEVDMKISTTLPKDNEGRRFLFRQLASFFNMVIAEWESALSKRDVSVKQSLPGRSAHNAMVQCRESLKPLIRKFEKGDVEDTILEPVVEVVHHAQLRRYVDANDAYLRLSIGKA